MIFLYFCKIFIPRSEVPPIKHCFFLPNVSLGSTLRSPSLTLVKKFTTITFGCLEYLASRISVRYPENISMI